LDDLLFYNVLIFVRSIRRTKKTLYDCGEISALFQLATTTSISTFWSTGRILTTSHYVTAKKNTIYPTKGAYWKKISRHDAEASDWIKTIRLIRYMGILHLSVSSSPTAAFILDRLHRLLQEKRWE
jgi:hypothetical protein